MRTIGHKYPRPLPNGDFATMCDVCGVEKHRKDVYLASDGLFVCFERGCKGPRPLDLGRENAQASPEAGAKPTRRR